MSWISDFFTSSAAKVVDSVGNAIDKLVTSDEEKLILRNALQQEMNSLQKSLESENTKQMALQRDVLMAEIQGENWMQRNWRPVAMLSFTFMIVNNFVLVPYGIAFGFPIPQVVIPDGVFTLLSLGMGGYMASLGAKEVVKSSKWSKDSK